MDQPAAQERISLLQKKTRPDDIGHGARFLCAAMPDELNGLKKRVINGLSSYRQICGTI
jgi:hypothetical protein